MFEDFREEILKSKEGSTAEKLAYALGYYEAILTRLAHQNGTNSQIIQKTMINHHKRIHR